MSNRYDRPKWYQQKRWILGSLLLFPPLGIPLLWLTRWPRVGKIGGSILSGLLLLPVLAGESMEPKNRWEQALSSLGDIPINSSDYSQAQIKMAEYQRNYDYAIAQRTAAESAEIEALAQQQAAEQAAAQQAEQAAAQQAEQAETQQAAEIALSAVEVEGGYVSGTCKDLKASGVGSNFTPGDANYTQKRDRDNDGVACES